MTVVYPVIYTRMGDKKNTFLVNVPDIGGATEGYGLADAIGMAKDYIANALCEMRKSDFPPPSDVNDIDPRSSCFAQAGESFVSLVDVDIDAYRRKEKSRSVRRNITLPEWLDEMATESKINVSALAQSALKKKLGMA